MAMFKNQRVYMISDTPGPWNCCHCWMVKSQKLHPRLPREPRFWGPSSSANPSLGPLDLTCLGPWAGNQGPSFGEPTDHIILWWMTTVIFQSSVWKNIYGILIENLGLNLDKIAQHDLKVKTSPGPTEGSDWQPAIKNQGNYSLKSG